MKYLGEAINVIILIMDGYYLIFEKKLCLNVTHYKCIIMIVK